MIIQEIINKLNWDNFFNENESPSFLQSWEWGEFEISQNYDLIRLGLFDDNNLLIGILQVIHIKARRGNFLFVPHGPIINKIKINSISKAFRALHDYLIDLGKKKNCAFIRISPVMENTKNNENLFKNLGYKTAPIYMHAERVWILPVDKNEDQLLNEMRKTTRYMIRKAIRDGVVIEKRTDRKAIEIFWRIYQETAKREKFVPFSRDFISKEFEAFHKSGNAMFLLGKTNGKYLAASLIVFTKSTGFYHQGASIHSKIPVPYLLQWEAIKETKKRGCRYYNFWGILQEGRTPKNWGGLTMFKQGFGGHQIDYWPTQDYILLPKYYLTYFYEKYLGWKRNI